VAPDRTWPIVKRSLPSMPLTVIDDEVPSNANTSFPS
jgi:hypothetical protein